MKLASQNPKGEVEIQKGWKTCTFECMDEDFALVMSEMADRLGLHITEEKIADGNHKCIFTKPEGSDIDEDQFRRFIDTTNQWHSEVQITTAL